MYKQLRRDERRLIITTLGHRNAHQDLMQKPKRINVDMYRRCMKNSPSALPVLGQKNHLIIRVPMQCGEHSQAENLAIPQHIFLNGPDGMV